MRRTPSSAASEIGERQRDDFTSPLQRLFDTAWAKHKMENKEQPPKNRCSRNHFLVKPFCWFKITTENKIQSNQKQVQKKTFIG
ncbi:MAG: hypothetical protein WAQ98_14570 [Blastocatellia bacterium]